jgi:nitrite reductase/ring-hydroxylating ferredoxin subunit
VQRRISPRARDRPYRRGDDLCRRRDGYGAQEHEIWLRRNACAWPCRGRGAASGWPMARSRNGSVGMTQSSPSVDARTIVIDLGLADEVLIRGRAVVSVGSDTSVLIIKTRRGVFAVQNRCPHLGLPLSSASVRRRNLRCDLHGREYDMRSGACRGGPRPRTRPLPTYLAWIRQDHLFLAL